MRVRGPAQALAQIKDHMVYFEGVVFSLDGKQKIDIKKEVKLSEAKDLGKTSAEEVLRKGGDKLMQEIRNENSTVH